MYYISDSNKILNEQRSGATLFSYSKHIEDISALEEGGDVIQMRSMERKINLEKKREEAASMSILI